MAKLTGKVAVVTGASKGIGAGIAKALARDGAKVIVNYATDASGAKAVVEEIRAGGGEALPVAANVAMPSDIDQLFRATEQAYGRVDILVNNAGIYPHQALANVTAESIDEVFGINVKGPLLATKAAVALFPAEGGSVVNIGSIVSKVTPPGASVYVGSKGAIDAITGSLARELGSRNIRVNAVLPGFTLTEGAKTSGMSGGAFEEFAISQTPLGRAGHPADIADVVCFLVSDEARWVTGSLLNAAGGF